ncbi:MAG TPA: hypothetical protein VM370_11705 [Candidatus Thermoplasmatota archaeon]|nr:hypothetical protein [Candidatus Thermoplasmatota archaeon]
MRGRTLFALALLLLASLAPAAVARPPGERAARLATGVVETLEAPGTATLVVMLNASGGDLDVSFAALGAGLPGSFTLATRNGTATARFGELHADDNASLSVASREGWQLVASGCSEGTPTDIELLDNGTTTCWFDEDKVATFRVTLRTHGGDGTFRVDAEGDDVPASFNITTRNGTGSTSFVVDDRSEHTATIVLPEGWRRDAGACDDVESSANGSAECVFVLTRLAEIHVFVLALGGDASFTLRFGQEGDDAHPFRIETDDGLAWRNFTRLDPGDDYELSLSAPRGWRITQAPCDEVDPTPGELVQCSFVVTRLGEASGGVRDARDGEGVEDVVVYADLDHDGRRDESEPADETDSHGHYRLAWLPLGDVTLRVALPSGWVATSPSSGARAIHVTVGSIAVDQDFLVKNATVAPRDDDEGDGGEHDGRSAGRHHGHGWWKHWWHHVDEVQVDDWLDDVTLPAGYAKSAAGLAMLVHDAEGHCMRELGRDECRELRRAVRMILAELDERAA